MIKLLRKQQLCYLMVPACEHYFESGKVKNILGVETFSSITTAFIFIGATRVVQKWIYEQMDLTSEELAMELSTSLKLMNR